MDTQDPPNRPRYQFTRGLNKFRQQKRCCDITLSGQKGSYDDAIPGEYTVLDWHG